MRAIRKLLAWLRSALRRATAGSPPSPAPDPLEHDLRSAADPLDPDSIPTPVTGPPQDFDPESIDLTGVEPMDPDTAKTIPNAGRAPSSHPPGRRPPKPGGSR